MTGGTLVAAGMMGMNFAIYGFNIVSARLLIPQEFGALTALFGIILVGTVAALGLQAVTARRLAVDPEHTDQIISATARVTINVSIGVGLLVALTTVVLTPVLKLDNYWAVILCGATLVPLTIMGAQAGIAQGTSRWGSLTAIYLGNGIGRLTGGTIALIISPTTTSAMIGIAIGSWTPVVAGARMLLGHHADGPKISRRPLVREALLSTHALLAYFALSNLDSLIARNRFDAHESGLYASGLILAKAALFFPQFVSVVVFPDLARATTYHARLRAVMLVGGFGALAVAATA
ncbi:MAG: polysaccharide biosynthesis protein, partial [Aeromicrobium sp.]|nr:polysaccharide biosynthesis protein [Aeromicrobium sp.]